MTLRGFAFTLAVAVSLIGCASERAAANDAAPQQAEGPRALAKQPPVPIQAIDGHIDHSGRKQSGDASFYADKFSGRKMADGEKFDPNAPVAASKTLPLGTVAKVENLENGKTATVRIEDRGPYVHGRVVDVSPKVADQLDLKKEGTAPVVVAPVTVPQPDGGTKLGAGAASGGGVNAGDETAQR